MDSRKGPPSRPPCQVLKQVSVTSICASVVDTDVTEIHDYDIMVEIGLSELGWGAVVSPFWQQPARLEGKFTVEILQIERHALLEPILKPMNESQIFCNPGFGHHLRSKSVAGNACEPTRRCNDAVGRV